MTNDVGIALALHVLAIVLWIGGVGFVTMAMLPALRRVPDTAQRLALFEAFESRFSRVARGSIVLAGATGLYMLFRLDAWSWFTMLPFWWMHAMVLVWLIFAVMLFVIEPFVLRRRFAARVKAAPDATFRAMLLLHWVLLLLGLITILGAAAGSHGVLLFG